MSKFVDKDGNELNKDILLWSGNHSGYSHEVILNDDFMQKALSPLKKMLELAK